MDDVMLIKYLSGNDPRGLPDGPDDRRQPGTAGRPRPDDTGGQRQYYDIDNQPTRGDDAQNGPEQTPLLPDDVSVNDSTNPTKRPLK